MSPKIVEIDYTLSDGVSKYHVIAVVKEGENEVPFVVERVLKEYQNDPEWIHPQMPDSWIKKDADLSEWEDRYPEYFI